MATIFKTERLSFLSPGAIHMTASDVLKPFEFELRYHSGFIYASEVTVSHWSSWHKYAQKKEIANRSAELGRRSFQGRLPSPTVFPTRTD